MRTLANLLGVRHEFLIAFPLVLAPALIGALALGLFG